MALVDHWPFFGLRVCTPRMELRSPDDELGCRLAELAAKGIHDPATMPFGVPWTDAPVEEMPRNSLQHYWLNRAQLRPESWHLSMVALVDGEVVGGGGLVAEHFAERRVFETGSWMARARQGQGLGFEFRQACLHLGFAGLDAEVATTAAWHDNAASLGVTRKLPYQPNGEDVLLRRDQRDRMLKFRMTRAAWEAVRRSDIAIEGLEPCLPLLVGPGAAASSPPGQPRRRR
jgi:RimJ/RimL family protein N-acetyltransferase